MRGRRRLRVDSAAKDAVPSPAGTHSSGSGVAPTSPAERRRVSLRRRARSRSPKTEAEPDGMEWERNNTVRLIELIRARPCLWDASSRRYTERHCRRDALADVARTLGVSLLCVQKKWTNLRTQYFRERTRLQTVPGHCPRWFGFNMMRFLEDGPIGQHARSSSVGSSGMVVEVVDDDSRADSCWATSSVDCGDSNRDPDDVEIVIEQAPFIKRQVKDPFDEDDEETRSNAPTPTPQIELQMPPATPPPAPPREATPTPTPPSPPPQKRLRSQAARAAQQQQQQQQLQQQQQQQQQQKQQQQQPQPSTSGATLRQPQVEAVPQPSRHMQQPHRDTEPPRPPLIGRTVPPPPPAANEPQRDYSPPPAAAVRGTKRRVEVVDPMTIPSTSTAAPSLAVIAEPPEEVHATLHDRLDMYALHVASRLRQIQDPYIRSVAINKIDNALFSAATTEMVQQRNAANAAHAAPAAPMHPRAPPPPAPATAANVHFPAANPHQAFPGLHAMGTYHQAPSMQSNHLSSVISDMQEEYIEELESKNLMVRLT